MAQEKKETPSLPVGTQQSTEISSERMKELQALAGELKLQGKMEAAEQKREFDEAKKERQENRPDTMETAKQLGIGALFIVIGLMLPIPFMLVGLAVGGFLAANAVANIADAMKDRVSSFDKTAAAHKAALEQLDVAALSYGFNDQEIDVMKNLLSGPSLSNKTKHIAGTSPEAADKERNNSESIDNRSESLENGELENGKPVGHTESKSAFSVWEEEKEEEKQEERVEGYSNPMYGSLGNEEDLYSNPEVDAYQEKKNMGMENHFYKSSPQTLRLKDGADLGEESDADDLLVERGSEYEVEDEEHIYDNEAVDAYQENKAQIGMQNQLRENLSPPPVFSLQPFTNSIGRDPVSKKPEVASATKNIANIASHTEGKTPPPLPPRNLTPGNDPTRS